MVVSSLKYLSVLAFCGVLFAFPAWAQEQGAAPETPPTDPSVETPTPADEASAPSEKGTAASDVSAPPEGDVPAPVVPETESTPVDSGSTPADAAEANAQGSSAPQSSEANRGKNIRLRELEERVNELKERIFRSKARLSQLQEVVLRGTVSGAKAIILHRNQMGSSFRLKRVQYSLDGAPVMNRVDTPADPLDDIEEFEVFSGGIAPGSHQLSVVLEYQGNGYGVFSYLKGYRFNVKSSYTFDIEEGKVTTVTIEAFERGGITTELKDRPAVRYQVESVRELQREGEAAAENGEEGE